MMIDNLCESFGWASNEHICKFQWTSMLDIQMTLMFCQKEKKMKKNNFDIHLWISYTQI